jgi:hypothetical protein
VGTLSGNHCCSRCCSCGNSDFALFLMLAKSSWKWAGKGWLTLGVLTLSEVVDW